MSLYTIEKTKDVVNNFSVGTAETGSISHSCVAITPMQIKICHDVAKHFQVIDYAGELFVQLKKLALADILMIDTVLTYILF